MGMFDSNSILYILCNTDQLKGTITPMMLSYCIRYIGLPWAPVQSIAQITKG